MDNRLYTAVDKSLFYDPDNILVGVMEFCEVEDGISGRAFDKIRGFFSHACVHNDFDGVSGIKTVSVYRRAGRTDRDTEEIKAVLNLLRKNDVKVKSGRQFYFCEGAGQNQIDEFIKENVNPYVFVSNLAPKPREAVFADENPIIEDFCQASYTDVVKMRKKFDLKMEIDDLMCVQNYFISESREPSMIEIKIIDHFFSENFRHTTFETILDSVETDDAAVKAAWEKYRALCDDTPSLADITRAAHRSIAKERVKKASKKLYGVKIETADDSEELLLTVKNKSHNRSTTSVPYDGAAGGIGGAVKDLLCALGYPYDAYRTVGQGVGEKTRKNAVTSAVGYSETASLMGIACSKCSETVSPIFDEKQHEVCSVLAVVDGKNAEKMLKKEPQEGDKIYLIGSKTGSDGSSCVYHNLRTGDSVGEYVSVTNGGELQSLIRLFTRDEFADIAVAINDVSSGGIVCALGEITDGADINVSAVAGRYEDVSVYDLVLSESNERMLVCIRSESSARLEELCKREDVGCVCIGTVNDDKRFVLYDDNGNKYASLTSEFLLSGGAEKHLSATVKEDEEPSPSEALAVAKAPLDAINPIKKLFGHTKYDFEKACLVSAADMESRDCESAHLFNRTAGGDISMLNRASLELGVSLRRLSNRGKAVLGKNGEPIYSAVSGSVSAGMSKTAPFRAAYLTLTEAVLKLIAAGFGKNEIYLSLQEYLPEHKNNSERLGVSVASMLGCFEAQMQLGVPSIGGRISIGNVSADKDVVSMVNAFAFCLCDKKEFIGSALTKAKSKVVLITTEAEKNGLPSGESISELADTVSELIDEKVLLSATVVNGKNVISALMDMCAAYKKGVKIDSDCEIESLFDTVYASVICEIEAESDVPKGGVLLGYTSDEHQLMRGEEKFDLDQAFVSNKSRKEPKELKKYLYLKNGISGYGNIKTANGDKVSVLMPITKYSVPQNDIKAAFEARGARVKVLTVSENNVSEFVKQIKKADIVWFTNGMGTNAFLNACLADKRVRAELDAMRERGGLIYGQGNSFEALLMSGLLDVDAERVSFSNTEQINEKAHIFTASRISPFMREAQVGKEYLTYVSGRRLKLNVDLEYADALAREGRIAVQYKAGENVAECSVGIDALTSADGRVFCQISRAFEADNALPIVESAVKYFSVYN